MRQLLVIALQAIRWRRWASVGFLLTATVAFATAGVAPLWVNAAEDSLIAAAVTEASGGRGGPSPSRPAPTSPA